jgi:hypothetical protein
MSSALAAEMTPGAGLCPVEADRPADLDVAAPGARAVSQVR